MTDQPFFRTPATRASSLSSWVAAVKRAVEAKGLDAAGLMRQAGMDLSLLDDPLARYPSEQTLAFWTLALQASGDPLLGLHTARHISPATFHALGYAALASSTLDEYFERAARYFRVVTDAGELTYTRTPSHGRFTMLGHPALLASDTAGVAWCLIDCFIYTTLRVCGLLYGPSFEVLEIRLQRPVPEQREVFEQVLRHTPIYGCDDNTVLVADEVLRKPLPHANTILARVNEEALSRYLADLNHGDNVSARLKRLLQERLPSGDPSQDELAALLHMTTRSLQRRLSELGPTYRELINQTRHELSLEYLAQRQHSISDIAYLLGFAEVSAFTRAFKRWTGQSPTAWREQA
jgi:AraC-like DNA-binding protein